MELTNYKCLIIMSIGLCTLTYQGYELILSFISTMESILQFCYLFSALILIALRKNNYTQECASVKQNSAIEQNPMESEYFDSVIKQNRATGGNVTTKPKVPTSAVNGTKRNTRLQKEFPSTAPGKIRVRGKSGPQTAVSEAVRENIELIENDLKVKESSLLDEMQGYLSEEDVIKITQSSRKDQAHFFAEIIEDLNDNDFLHVLNILNKSSFGHISKELKKSYETYLTSTQLPSTLCPICRIQSELNIKSLRCGLIKEGLLPKDLKRDINNCQASKGHQNVLWHELLYHLKTMQQKQDISEKFMNLFKVSKHVHRYILSYLSQHGMLCYNCTCDTIKPTIKSECANLFNLHGSEESTTSSIEVTQEPQWYKDAVHSTSSREESKSVTMKSRKKLDRSSHSHKKKKNVKAEKKTSSTHRISQKLRAKKRAINTTKNGEDTIVFRPISI